jgi:catechol 2,3-dioxygenase-like lactoylglutathione lyase family enzyme
MEVDGLGLRAMPDSHRGHIWPRIPASSKRFEPVSSLHSEVRHDRAYAATNRPPHQPPRRRVAFYRDRVGFPEIGRFENHDGYDGVFLEIPGTNAHFELTTGGDHAPPDPHPESLIVLFLESQAAIDEIAGQINQPPVVPANPYWRANAQAYADPDGFQLLLALSA